MEPDKRPIAVILAVYLLFGFFYSIFMPVWEAPDERAHFAYALQIARTGEAPEYSANYEAYQPPLYYRLVSLPLRVVEALAPDWNRLLSPPLLPPGINTPRYDWNAANYAFLGGPLIVRWIGVLAGAVAVALVYSAVRRGAPDFPGLALGTAGLMAGIPQFIHISASVNNDVLAILVGAVLFRILAEVTRADTDWKTVALAVALAVSLPVISKLTAAPTALALLAAALLQFRRQLNRKTFFKALSGITLLFVLAVLFLAWTGALERMLFELGFRLFTVRATLGSEPITTVVGRLLRSFWGRVGWLSVGLPLWTVLTLSLGAAIGLLAGARALLKKKDAPGFRLIAYSWAAILLAGLMIVRNFIASPQMQGRFLFPTLGPICLLIVFGALSLFPGRGRGLAAGLAILMAILNVYLLVSGVIPVYYQPFIDG